MALQLSRTVNYGRAHGLRDVRSARCSGIAVHTTLVALGISMLIVAAPPLFLALKIVGAVYLLWLAWQAIAQAAASRLRRRRSRRRRCGRAF